MLIMTEAIQGFAVEFQQATESVAACQFVFGFVNYMPLVSVSTSKSEASELQRNEYKCVME